MKKTESTTIKRTVTFPGRDLHVREVEGENPSRVIEGCAIVFNSPSIPLYEDDEVVVREVIDPVAVPENFLRENDIKMTMFHNRELILARSNKGKGTLTFSRDDKGVYFSFEAPETVDGDKALELVRRGDLAGCSFLFETYYYNEAYVTRTREIIEGKTEITARVNKITKIFDFTLAADPAYPATDVEARETYVDDEEKPSEILSREETVKSIAEIREFTSRMR